MLVHRGSDFWSENKRFMVVVARFTCWIPLSHPSSEPSAVFGPCSFMKNLLGRVCEKGRCQAK